MRYLLFIGTFAGVILGSAVAWYTNGQSLLGVDDANIYFAYMRNLANGDGFLYNHGTPPVEGFTSLLWTLFGSVFFWFTSEPFGVLLIFNVLIIGFSLWRLTSVLRKISSGVVHPIYFQLTLIGLLLMVPGFFAWVTLSLMETGLWCAILLLTIAELTALLSPGSHSHKRFVALLPALVLCRPEAFLWVPVFIVLKFIVSGSTEHFRFDRRRQLLIEIAVFAAISGLITLWRILNFGYPLPNTYYAKVSPDFAQNFTDGLDYLSTSFDQNPLILIFLALNLPGLWRWRRSFGNEALFNVQWIFTVCITVLLLSQLITGGDHFGYARHLQPLIPVVYASGLLGLLSLRIPIKTPVILLLFAVASFLTHHERYHGIRYQSSSVSFEWSIPVKGRAMGHQMNVFWRDLDDYPLAATHLAGGFNYVYQGYSIDLLGLNHPEMAHANNEKNPLAPKNHGSFHPETFYRLHPDLFISDARFVSPENQDSSVRVHPKHRIMFENIYASGDFQEQYTPVRINHLRQNITLVTYASNDFLRSLPDELYAIDTLITN